jgi:hypothetical protein
MAQAAHGVDSNQGKQEGKYSRHNRALRMRDPLEKQRANEDGLEKQRTSEDINSEKLSTWARQPDAEEKKE